MAIEREIVKKLHREVNQALAQVAKANGFVFNPGNFTYTDLDVRGRMSFIKADKQVEFSNRNTISSVPSLGLAVGDVIVLGITGDNTKYKITSFGKRGCINVERTSDNKGFRIGARYTSTIKRVDFKGAATEAKTQAQIDEEVRQNLIQGASKRSELKIMEDLAAVYNQLSPENITCDGELPVREVNRRRTQLNRELRRLFNELGREVDELEVYNYVEKNGTGI